MVIVLLLSLAATVVTGLLAYAAGEKSGPLAPFFGATSISSLPAAAAADTSGQAVGGDQRGEDQAETFENLHELLANVTLALVALHILGVAFASVAYRENLVEAMLTGRKRGPDA